MPHFMLFALLLFASTLGLADDSSLTQQLDQDVLTWRTVHGNGQVAPLAVTAEGKPLAVLLRLPKDGVLEPHSGGEGWYLITVVSGTLSYADGAAFDTAKLVDYPAGSVLVLPQSTMHYAAARQADVLLQVTLIHPQDSLSADVSQQVTEPDSASNTEQDGLGHRRQTTADS